MTLGEAGCRQDAGNVEQGIGELAEQEAGLDLLVEPEQPFLGTVRLEALPYRNVDISKFYPYGDPRPFQQRSRPC